jgi:hypothetical protein
MNHSLIYIIYADEDQSYTSLVWLVRFLLHFYPPFLFSKCYTDVARISSYHFDSHSLQWVPGRLFELNDVLYGPRGTLRIGIRYSVDSFLYTTSWFIILITLYISIVSLLELNAGIKGGSLLKLKNLTKVIRETLKNFNLKKTNVKKQIMENSLIKLYDKFLKTEDGDPNSLIQKEGIKL